MIELNFKIDKRYLVAHTLQSCAPSRFVKGPDPEIVEFQNKAWRKDQEAYLLLQQGLEVLPRKNSWLSLARRLDSLVKEMVEDPAFAPIYEVTKDSLKTVKDEWQGNLARAQVIMEDLTGLNFDRSVDVYITHPSQKNGMLSSVGILWSHRSTWPNYNTVYLWHEIMHYYLEFDAVSHAVIELVTDNELRVRLGGKKYPPLKGHRELERLKKQLLPAWSQYLKKRHRKIASFVKSARSLINIDGSAG